MAAAGEVHDPIAALRIANYRLFGAGFSCSSTGLQMLSTAVAWEVWERTHDPLELGYIGLARALPVVLVALPAGHLADLHDRRRIVAITQAAFALTAALLAVASAMHAPMWCFYLLLVMSGTVRAFNGPSRAGLLPLLVPECAFGNAVTFNSGIFQSAAILGPLAAGYIIGLTGLTWLAYAACAVGCSVLSVTILFVKPHAAQRATGSMTFNSMLAGMGHLWRERTILGAILLDLLAVLFGGATALLPLYADEVLHVGPEGLGWLRAAPFIGALGVAGLIALRPIRHAGAALLWSVAGFGVCMVVFGLSTSMVLSMGALAMSGALDNVSVVVRHVLVQMRTPNQLRGRVGAVNSMFIECSNELGGFESGLVARMFGPVFSVVSGGIGTLVVVGAIAWGFPQLRRLGKIEQVDQNPTP